MRGIGLPVVAFALGCGGSGVVTIPDASIDQAAPIDAPSCTPGSALCNGKCVDLAASNDNCGGCGVQCGNAALCMAGQCAACPAGFSVCSGKCANLVGDAKNCGQCANACPLPQVCAAGLCATACPIGLSKCGTSCIDTLTDPNNCGGCAIACTGNQTCVSGVCCNTGDVLCNGKCTDTQTDPSHCGMCNQKCAGKCAGGQCCTTPPTGNCSHALCDQGANLAFDCDADGCVKKICAQDDYCCTVGWDSICVGEVDTYCGPKYSCSCM